MAWSKRGVVIVKRGDQEWTDAIEQSMNIKLASQKELEELIKENEELRKQNEILRRIVAKATKRYIDDAERNYGYNWKPPKWANRIVGIFSYIIYKFSVFIDSVAGGNKRP